MYTSLASTGNYFGTHFFMGGEKFETMKPDVYLFGENEDLNFLGSKPSPVSDYFDVQSGWIFQMEKVFVTTSRSTIYLPFLVFWNHATPILL